MKRLIVFFITLFIFDVPVSFGDDDCNCDHPKIKSEHVVENLENWTRDISNAPGGQMTVADLSSDICRLMIDPSNHSKKTLPLEKMIEGEILSFIGVSNTDPSYRNKIASFWNKEHDNLVCKRLDTSYPRQHILQRAIILRREKELFHKFFFKKGEEIPIDLNKIVSFGNGVEGTIIDNLDYIINDPSKTAVYEINKIKSLKRVIERMKSRQETSQ